MAFECVPCPERDCVWCNHSGTEHRDIWDLLFQTGDRPYVELGS